MSGSSLVSNNTYTLFSFALASAAKSSARTVLLLLEADILRILYQLLTGGAHQLQMQNIPTCQEVMPVSLRWQ